MIKLKYNPVRHMTQEEIDELTNHVASASSVVKLMCGVANNAAWLVMAKAFDCLKKSPRYKHDVKRLFKAASTEIHRYENRLVTATIYRMFHVADMSPEIRRRYGDITDRDYYEFWKGIGATAYTKTQPYIESLQHKYALSVGKHHVKDPEIVAWVMTAMAALNIATEAYNRALKTCEENYNLKRPLLERFFGQFNLKPVADRWMTAMFAFAPDTDGYELDEVEERNIAVGIDQLADAWLSPDTLYTSTGDTVAEYEEVFASKGFQRKIMTEIADIHHETNRIINEL